MRIFVWISGICQALWGDSVLAPQVCSKTLSVCERAPLVCWCVQGRGAGGSRGFSRIAECSIAVAGDRCVGGRRMWGAPHRAEPPGAKGVSQGE